MAHIWGSHPLLLSIGRQQGREGYRRRELGQAPHHGRLPAAAHTMYQDNRLVTAPTAAVLHGEPALPGPVSC